MTYHVLVLDLDGTLTNSQKEISKDTLNALIDIQKRGKKVILASGRPTKGVLPLAEQLHLSDYGSYILSFNGARITNCRDGSLLYNKTLPSDITAPLFQIFEKYSGINILHYRSEELLCSGVPNEYSQLESRINHMPIRQVTDFPSHITEPPNKFLITGEPAILQSLKAEMQQRFRSYLSLYFSDPFFLEVMPQGIDKAHSLLKLLSSTGFTQDAMICCGDGENDITMIETAGLGVAMANAQGSVLERADYVTKSNDEDGVLHVINKFMRA